MIARHNTSFIETTPSSSTSSCGSAARRALALQRRGGPTTPVPLVPICAKHLKHIGPKACRLPLTAVAATTMNQPQQSTSQAVYHKPTAQIHLPIHLIRPHFQEIDSRMVETICPDLAGVPPFFVRNILVSVGASMIKGRSNMQFSIPKTIPPTLDVAFKEFDEPTIPPTHILALSSTPNKVKLFPVHALPLAASCSKLGLFPPSPTSEGIPTTKRAKLPVVSLNIPCVESFPILLAYIYKKDDEILRSLLVLEQPESQPGVMLLRRALILHGLWRNAQAFGLVDMQFYDVVDEAWRQIVHLILPKH